MINKYDQEVIDNLGEILEGCKKKVYKLFQKDYPRSVSKDALIPVINGFFIQVMRERFYMLQRAREKKKR